MGKTVSLHSRGRTALLAGAGIALACAVQAQDTDTPGLHMTLDFSQRLEADSNLDLDVSSPGTSYISTTSLNFGLSSRTRTQSLTLNAATKLRVRNDPGGTDSGTSFDEPSLRFAYQLDGARARLNLGGSYRKSDISFLRPESDFIGPGGIITLPTDLADLTGTGNRVSYGLNGRLEFGRDAPLGLILRASHDVLNYSNTTSTSLFDTTRNKLGATVRLRFSPIMEGNFKADYNTYEADDTPKTDRRSTLYSFGISRDLSKALTLEAALGYSKTETDETIGGIRSTTTKDGATGSLGLTWEQANGTLTANLEHSVDQNGARTEFTLGRSLDLPRGSLSASIGASRGDSGKTEMIGALDWRHDLPGGSLSARIARSVASGTDDTDELLTRINLNYNHEINAVSSFGLTASHIINDQFLTGTKVRNTSVGATYRRSLTQDWDMRFGYSYRTRQETGAARAKSHSVFVSLDRQFSIRP